MLKNLLCGPDKRHRRTEFVPRAALCPPLVQGVHGDHESEVICPKQYHQRKAYFENSIFGLVRTFASQPFAFSIKHVVSHLLKLGRDVIFCTDSETYLVLEKKDKKNISVQSRFTDKYQFQTSWHQSNQSTVLNHFYNYFINIMRII